MPNNQQKSNTNPKESKNNSAFFVDIERFIARIIRNWLLFIISIVLAVFIATYINNWHLDRIYQASSTFHVSTRSSGNTNLASNYINFIWCGIGGINEIITKL